MATVIRRGANIIQWLGLVGGQPGSLGEQFVTGLLANEELFGFSGAQGSGGYGAQRQAGRCDAPDYIQ